MITATAFSNRPRHAPHNKMYADRLRAFVERASTRGGRQRIVANLLGVHG